MPEEVLRQDAKERLWVTRDLEFSSTREADPSAVRDVGTAYIRQRPAREQLQCAMRDVVSFDSPRRVITRTRRFPSYICC